MLADRGTRRSVALVVLLTPITYHLIPTRNTLRGAGFPAPRSHVSDVIGKEFEESVDAVSGKNFGHGGDGARQAIREVVSRLRNSPATRSRYDRGRSIVGDPEAPAYRPFEFLHPLLARSVPLYFI